MAVKKMTSLQPHKSEIRQNAIGVPAADKSTVRAIGVMSGTSLDGVDLTICELIPPANNQAGWQSRLETAITIPYTKEWIELFNSIPQKDAPFLAEYHAKFGKYLGILVRNFTKQVSSPIAFVASHGHTIFHQPDSKGFTFQLGEGAALAAAAGLPVICDFRTLDVALGGQGAPLVPIGDRLLFGDYGCCLNLGGIANLSVETASGRRAYDICACNQLLNALILEIGLPYDADGALARTGRVDKALLAALDAPAYFRQAPPKSLGREWVEMHQLPLLRNPAISLPDRLRTVVRHIARQIADSVRAAFAQARPSSDRRVLITGGGAFNGLLVEEIRAELADAGTVVVPDAQLVNYKEALIFALLGALRWRGEINTLASVTGAARDSVGGAIYLP